MRRAVLLLTLLAGCSPAPPPNELRTAHPGDFLSFDPALAYDMTTIDYARLIHHSLLDYDDTGTRLVPVLAEAVPEVSGDGTVYTFRVRAGVRYSTGRELVASDFVFAINRVLQPQTKSPWSQYFRNVLGADDVSDGRSATARGLTAPDRRTLRIELSKPDATLPFVMAMPYTAPLPPEEVLARGADFGRRPVGTGPYVLASWQRNVEARFERNAHYRLSPRPALDAVRVRLGHDRLTQVMMFERGEIDVLSAIPPGDFVRLRDHPKWGPRLVSLTENGTFFLVMNTEVPPFDDLRVRLAFSHAVNRRRIVHALNGRGVPARGVIPPLLPGHDPDLEGYAHDPPLARRLLAEAGHGKGLAVTLWVARDINGMDKVAEVIQQDLRAVGVRVKLNVVAYNVYLGATGKRREVALSLSGWFQDYPDPSTFLDVLFHGERITDIESTNTAFLDDPEVNRLIDDASRQPLGPHRLELYRAAERAVLARAPAVFLFHQVSYAVASPRVRGHALHPVWVERLDRLSLERP